MTPKEIQGNLNPNSEREGAADLVGFEELERAYPKAGLKFTDRAAAFAAYQAELAGGVDRGELVACAVRCAADPVWRKRDHGPPGLQIWLTRGQWRGWRADEPAAEARAEQAAPSALPADVVAGLGGEFVSAWAGGAQWVEAERIMVTRLGLQADTIRNGRREALQRLGVRVMSAAEFAAYQSEGARQ